MSRAAPSPIRSLRHADRLRTGVHPQPDHDAQHEALDAAGCERIFLDTASGKLASRPELDDALMVARAGDELVVTRLDRLGRSLAHLIDLAGDLQARQVHLVVLEQGIDASTAVGRCFPHTRCNRRNLNMHSCQSEPWRGIQAARARGRTGGQKPQLTPRQARIAKEMYDSGEHTVAQIAAEFGVSRPTIYRHLARLTDSGPQPGAGEAAT